MALRRIAWLLAIVVVAIQWPLWFGKGGWLRVWELQQQVAAQRADNAVLADRNAALAAELDSLRAGREAIEERARTQLNMLRPDEVFVQYVPRGSPAQPATGESAATGGSPEPAAGAVAGGPGQVGPAQAARPPGARKAAAGDAPGAPAAARIAPGNGGAR